MNKSEKSFAAKVIGRLEHIDFPEWNITCLDAKIDTGAYTSSLHCHHVEQYTENNVHMVRFYLLDPDHPEYEKTLYSSVVKNVRKVKSSNGIIEERVAVKTKMSISNRSYTIELTLADRTNMKYPVLIGRKFLQNKFIVDVSKKYLTD